MIEFNDVIHNYQKFLVYPFKHGFGQLTYNLFECFLIKYDFSLVKFALDYFIKIYDMNYVVCFEF